MINSLTYRAYTGRKESAMFRIDVWVHKSNCFYPGIRVYTHRAEAEARAKELRDVGHKVKIVPVDAPKYTEN
jgi:hypothetical protein